MNRSTNFFFSIVSDTHGNKHDARPNHQHLMHVILWKNMTATEVEANDWRSSERRKRHSI